MHVNQNNNNLSKNNTPLLWACGHEVSR